MVRRLRVWWQMWLKIRFPAYYIFLTWVSCVYAFDHPFITSQSTLSSETPQLLSLLLTVMLSGLVLLLCHALYHWEIETEKEVVKGDYIKATGGELSFPEEQVEFDLEETREEATTKKA